MAIWDASTGEIKVEWGDTLSGIAEWAKKKGINTSVDQLAAINGIENKDLIKEGATLKTSGSTKKTTTAKKVKIKDFGLRSDKPDELFATWDWSEDSRTEEYKYHWQYYVKDGFWMLTDGSSKYRYATFTVPEEATIVQFKVKPISKTHEVKNGDQTTNEVYWVAEYTAFKDCEFYTKYLPPDQPSGAPTVTLDGLKLTCRLDNIGSDTSQIQFEIVQDDKTSVHKGKANVKQRSVSYSWNAKAGANYKVRCRAVRAGLYSAWTDFSKNEETPPAAPAKITKCEARSETSVYLEWSKVSTAKSYEIQYTDKKSNFDTNDLPQSKNGIEFTKFEVTGLESGKEYFFRVRSTNASTLNSGWTGVKSVKIGKAPSPPTTWSSSATAITGEPVTLYWLHNTEDGSKQTKAWIELDIGGKIQTIEPKIDIAEDDEEEKTSFYVLQTSGYTEGAQVKWRVKTRGIIAADSDWSTQRTIDIHAAPTIELDMKYLNGDPINRYHKVEYTGGEYIETSEVIEWVSGELVGGVQTTSGKQIYSYEDDNGDLMYYCEDQTVDKFPLVVTAIPGPRTQVPLGYHVSITANSDYETVDRIGNTKLVSEGEEVYSQYFDNYTYYYDEFEDYVKLFSLNLLLSADSLDLENGIDYTLSCTVSMDSGLTATESIEFTVGWQEATYFPTAEIGINDDIYSASIRPYCEEATYEYRRVTRTARGYNVTDEVIPGVYGTARDGVFTTTGEQVYYGTTSDGDKTYYCEVKESKLVEGVKLAVYRREFDGAFTEIAKDLDNTEYTYITDPHPALDYARYRIVATETATGAVSYYDLPEYTVGCKSIIIQWDEEWSSFYYDGTDSTADRAWTGSMLKLPYNIDVSDKNSPDVSLVSYIGRKRPVSYYGTHLDETSTWSTVIPKDDEETIYALRRLQNYMGDVYVREPSGTGYWANITVSFNQKHLDTTIPVTFDITRVEGGI